MKFELLKVLEKMQALYTMPRSRERFEKYLHLLQGNSKSDMLLPIASFNPMGKELAKEKIEALLSLEAEQLAEQELNIINQLLDGIDGPVIKVALNLSDDVEGSWSSFHTTSYKNIFDINGLLNRNFCTPIFWTSETVNTQMITQRTREYVLRTAFWIQQGAPQNLEEMVEQEIYVNLHLDIQSIAPGEKATTEIRSFFETHKNSSDYNLNFNFFYGDEACWQVGYPTFGNPPKAGFKLARLIAKERLGQ